MNDTITDTVMQLADRLNQYALKVVTAESCTGGGLAEMLTRIAGSSNWFERGFVTYSNEAKIELLNVDQQTLQQFGAVSEEVAAEMAAGALINSHAQLGVSITGIAGPGGGSADKPVGTVCFGWCRQHGQTKTTRIVFAGDRLTIRQQACLLATQGLLDMAAAESE